ncbi:MAG: MBL fold metallo-hydrolase [Bacillota bacterium]
MQKNYIVWHIFHSGIAIFNKTSKNLHIFDLYKDPENAIEDIQQSLSEINSVHVYVTHAHHDHYSPKIFQLNFTAPNIYYFDIGLKNKIPENTETEETINYFKVGDSLQKDNLFIKAYPSTDAGVSFYIKDFDRGIFHGGDLNWWDWSSFSPEERRQEETDFKNAVEQIKTEDINLACLAIDPRLEESYHLAARYFIKETKPKILIPLHFQTDYSVIQRFNQTYQQISCLIPEFKQPGDKIEL